MEGQIGETVKKTDFQRNDVVEVDGKAGVVEGYNKKGKIVVLLVRDATRIAVDEKDILPSVRKRRDETTD